MFLQGAAREAIQHMKRAPFARVDPLVRAWAEEIGDDIGECADFDYRQVENTSYDGFTPYTEGGWDGVGRSQLDYFHSTGYRLPKLIQPYLDSTLKDCAADWDERNPSRPYVGLFGSSVEDEDEGQQTLPGIEASRQAEADRDDYYEHERSWLLEGSTFFWKVRALYYDVGNRFNVSGKPEVYFMVGINNDFEYGRDSISWLKGVGTTWVWERNVPVAKLNVRVFAQMKHAALKALHRA